MSSTYAAAALALAIPAACLAQQITATILHPPGADASVIYALADGRQGGLVRPAGDTDRAAVWGGSASSLTLLDAGEVFAMAGARQGGWWPSGACYWSGSPQSRVDLSCCGVGGRVYAMGAGLQAGSVELGAWHAAVWSSEPGTMIDVHPTADASSAILAGDGQGVDWAGYINTPAPGAAAHAALWQGPGHAFVDLHPASAMHSMAYAGAPGVQGGYCSISGVRHASLWRGSAATVVDLHPAGADDSCVYAMSGGYEAGSVNGRGALWTAAGPAIDLHGALPPGYQTSEAFAIAQRGPMLEIGGYAFASGQGTVHAVLWTVTVPCYPNCDGSGGAPVLNVADFSCFLRRFGAGDGYANCDSSTAAPTLSIADFTCYLRGFASGCP